MGDSENGFQKNEVELVNVMFLDKDWNYKPSSFIQSAASELKNLQKNWNSGKCKVRTMLLPEKDTVCSLQISHDKIVGGLRNKQIRIWDRQNLEHVHTITSPAAIRSLRLKNEIIIASINDYTLKVWDTNTGELVNSLAQPKCIVTDIDFNYKILVTCSLDGSINVWDIVNPSEINFRSRIPNSADLLPRYVKVDQNFIISAASDKTVDLWETSNVLQGKKMRAFTAGPPFFQKYLLSLHYQHPQVLQGYFDEIVVFDVTNGKCIKTVNDDGLSILRCDQNRILYTVRKRSQPDRIKIMDLKSFSPICELVENIGELTRVEFDAFGIAAVSRYQKGGAELIAVWDFLDC